MSDRKMTEGTLRIKVALPDLWRETSIEIDAATPVAVVKELTLPELLGTTVINPAEYYVEYFEKEVLDEGKTLADLGVQDRGVLLLRPYNVGHPPPFKG